MTPIDSDVSRLGLLAREAPVVELLRSVLKVEDPGTQGVLDRFVDSYGAMVRGEAFSDAGYIAMRQIYAATRGWIDGVVDAKIRDLFPPPPASDLRSTLFGDLSAGEIGRIVESLERDGVHLFEHRFPEEELAGLGALLEKTSVRDECGGDWTYLSALHDSRARYMFDESQLYAAESPWRIIADPVLLGIVEQYLRCQPVLDSLSAYATFPGSGDADELSRSAQMFHADKDRLSFIKFFVYLSDVDDEAGPHVYMAGSHRAKPDHLWRDGRFSDEEVFAAYPPEAVRKIVGPRGTMFLADTRGIHKGMPVRRGRRVMFQIEYSNSCAGKHCPPEFQLAEHPLARRLADRHPRLLMRFG